MTNQPLPLHWEMTILWTVLLTAWIGLAAYVIVYGCYEWRAIWQRMRQRRRSVPRQNVRVSR